MTDTLIIARQIWEEAIDTKTWSAATAPKPNLIWRSGHPRQVADLDAFAHLLGAEVRIAGAHRSKSVSLPVGIFHLHAGNAEAFILTRDNFYDRKVAVIASHPLSLDYAVVHTPMTKEAHDAEKQRAYAYQSRPPDADLSVFETDAWYTGWYGGTLLRDGEQVYTAQSVASCYCEGIDDLLPSEVFVPYTHGASTFTCAVGTAAQQLTIMAEITEALRRVSLRDADHG